MREETGRNRETFDLSLDGRQIASIVVGALVVLAVVFVLGLNVGRQLALRQASSEDGEAALAALDRAPAPPAEPVREESLTFHDKLTKESAAIPPAPPAVESAPSQSPRPTSTATAAPTPTAPQASSATSGSFSVQVGATQQRAEADRIAAKFKTYRPRVEAAEIDGKGTWYRVRVGSFETKDAAERYRKDLARETGVQGYVAQAL